MNADTIPQGITIANPPGAGTSRRLYEALHALQLPVGIDICETTAAAPAHAPDAVAAPQAPAGLSLVQARLAPQAFARITPDFDTLGIARCLGLDTTSRPGDLEREIALAMLAAPVALHFPSVDECLSAIEVRRHIVQAARRTALAFDTEAAERPEAYWHYDEDRGFLLNPGVDYVEALERTTQPDTSGKLYSFSCYRATEYVIQLGLARELRDHNRPLYAALVRQCEQEAIRSGRFHDTFLYEYGSQEAPCPPRFYVPGDRVWFRNPDERSADVAGFEGSWVFYHGDALFTNFWKRDAPFTFTAKCLEIYHWRDGAVTGPDGELVMDESIVEARVKDTLRDPAAVEQILARMVRLRDPRGVYAEGGCIDSSREFPRWVRPGSADIRLPGLTSHA